MGRHGSPGVVTNRCDEPSPEEPSPTLPDGEAGMRAVLAAHPADEHGTRNTNYGRSRPYDVVLVDWGRAGWEDRGVTLDELVARGRC